MPISVQAPVKQDEFFDMRFCGKRGGQSFMNAIRPLPTGKTGTAAYECPKDTVKCSPKTSNSNTICIATNKKADCPITFAKFIKTSEKSKYSDTAKYKVHKVDSEHEFVTSKVEGDNLPLTSFKVEKKPCLDSSDTSKSGSTVFYPLENDKNVPDCVNVKQFNEMYDSRYADMGMEISEYEVQKESKVLKKLE